jgi:dienelactone hydrolase
VTSSKELTDAYTGGKYRFAGHLPLYPVCWAHVAMQKGANKVYPPSIYAELTGAPVEILAGEKDDYDDPDTCRVFVDGLPQAARTRVTLIVYPGVGHGWDTREDRRYFDDSARKGQGGSVAHYGDRATAEKSREEAVAFFKRALVPN